MGTLVLLYAQPKNVHPFIFVDIKNQLNGSIQIQEYPPSAKNMAEVLLALVAALNESCGAERTIRFILDLIAPQLHGLDLTDVWDLQNPMGYLAKVGHFGSRPFCQLTVIIFKMR